jgi:serine/threonine-protein kinase RsbW
VALDLEIPSDIKQIERVVKLAVEQCRALHLSSRVCTFNVPVALTEALSNAVLRGNHEDRSKQVRMRATVSDHSIIFDVIDEGPGFNLEKSMHDPTLASNLEREDGRGLFLMQQLVDHVEQFHDRGNVVRLVVNR